MGRWPVVPDAMAHRGDAPGRLIPNRGGALALSPCRAALAPMIEALRAEAGALAAAPQLAAASRLARREAHWIGRMRGQMEQAESLHNAALWSTCDDQEIDRLRDELRAAIDPPAAGDAPQPIRSLHAPGSRVG